MAGTITAQGVFDLAMGLMGEVNENTGATDTSDTKEYKVRTLFILNVLKGELFPYSDTYAQTTDGTRPVCATIADFTTAIGIDDVICTTIMPYGLAAHLLLDENPDMASFFEQRYEELKTKLQNAATSFSQIEDVYDCAGLTSEYNNFGRW